MAIVTKDCDDGHPRADDGMWRPFTQCLRGLAVVGPLYRFRLPPVIALFLFPDVPRARPDSSRGTSLSRICGTVAGMWRTGCQREASNSAVDTVAFSPCAWFAEASFHPSPSSVQCLLQSLCVGDLFAYKQSFPVYLRSVAFSFEIVRLSREACSTKTRDAVAVCCVSGNGRRGGK